MITNITNDSDDNSNAYSVIITAMLIVKQFKSSV